MAVSPYPPLGDERAYARKINKCGKEQGGGQGAAPKKWVVVGNAPRAENLEQNLKSSFY